MPRSKDSPPKSDHRIGNNAAYEPTEAEIAAACLEIQSGWTEYEEGRRRWKFRGRVIEDCARRYRLWAELDEGK